MATRTRPYHHGDLRSALLAEAAAMLRTEGAEALSLRELARRVDVSHAAPRRHFPDKQALLDALALDGFARLQRLLAAAAETSGTSGTSGAFAARLAALGEAYARFAVDEAALLDLMWTGKHRPGADPALAEAGERCLAAPAAVIAAAQQAGEVVAGDVEPIATTVFAAVQGLATLTGSGLLDPDALPAHVRAMATHLTEGLRPR